MKALTDHHPMYDECVDALYDMYVQFPYQFYFCEEKKEKECPYGLGLKRRKDPLTMHLVFPLLGKHASGDPDQPENHIYEFNLRDCVHMEAAELYKGIEKIRDALLGFVHELDEVVEQAKNELAGTV